MGKKRGRPRKFNKKAFLKGISAGCSRKEVCDQLGISYKTLEYHLNRDKYFQGKVRNAKLIRPPSAEEIEEWARFEKEFEKEFEKKHGVPYSVFEAYLSNEPPEKWFETSKYFSKIIANFDLYLKYLAERNKKKWGHVIREIRQWYKWNQDKRRFFQLMFTADPVVVRWHLYGAPQLPEIETYLAQVEGLFEDYKREKEYIEDYIKTLQPSELQALQKAFDDHINEIFSQEKELYFRSRKNKSQSR